MATSELKPGGARIIVEWGYDNHEVVLDSAQLGSGEARKGAADWSPGFSEEGFQWEYWSFAGGLDGDLVVEYGDDGGTGFTGKLADAAIEEAPGTPTVAQTG